MPPAATIEAPPRLTKAQWEESLEYEFLVNEGDPSTGLMAGPHIQREPVFDVAGNHTGAWEDVQYPRGSIVRSQRDLAQKLNTPGCVPKFIPTAHMRDSSPKAYPYASPGTRSTMPAPDAVPPTTVTAQDAALTAAMAATATTARAQTVVYGPVDGKDDTLSSMSEAELRKEAADQELSLAGVTSREDMVRLLRRTPVKTQSSPVVTPASPKRTDKAVTPKT